MGDNSTKNIETVRKGDFVTATDPMSGKTAPHKVTAVIVTDHDKRFNRLTMATPQGRANLTATSDHPFWSPSQNGWLKATELRRGMTLRSADGSSVKVIDNHPFAGNARTYNLTVDDLHTYYVLAGKTSVLVHNSADPASFENLIPEDKPDWFKPIAPGTVLIRSGNYAYVVLESGELVIGKRTAGHVSLAKGGKVLAAGEFKTKGGQIVYLDNKSGHYRPYGENAQKAAIDAFNRNGLHSDGKYIAAWEAPHC